MRSLAEYIRETRRDNDIRLRHAAEVANVSIGYWSGLENGKKFVHDLATAEKVAAAIHGDAAHVMSLSQRSQARNTGGNTDQRLKLALAREVFDSALSEEELERLMKIIADLKAGRDDRTT